MGSIKLLNQCDLLHNVSCAYPLKIRTFYNRGKIFKRALFLGCVVIFGVLLCAPGKSSGLFGNLFGGKSAAPKAEAANTQGNNAPQSNVKIPARPGAPAPNGVPQRNVGQNQRPTAPLTAQARTPSALQRQGIAAQAAAVGAQRRAQPPIPPQRAGSPAPVMGAQRTRGQNQRPTTPPTAQPRPPSPAQRQGVPAQVSSAAAQGRQLQAAGEAARQRRGQGSPAIQGTQRQGPAAQPMPPQGPVAQPMVPQGPAAQPMAPQGPIAQPMAPQADIEQTGPLHMSPPQGQEGTPPVESVSNVPENFENPRSPQTPPESSSNTQSPDESIAFILYNGKIQLYKTKLVAIPLDEELKENALSPTEGVRPGERLLTVFNPEEGRMTSYVQTKVAISIDALVDLKDRFAQRSGQLDHGHESPKNIQEKLEEIKRFFMNLLGYAPMGLEEAYTLNVEEISGHGFDPVVVVPQLYIPQEEKVQSEMETGDSRKSQPQPQPHHSGKPGHYSHKLLKNKQKKQKEPAKKKRGKKTVIKEKGDSQDPLPSSEETDLPEEKEDVIEEGTQDESKHEPENQTSALSKLRPETRKELINSGLDLSPFFYKKEDKDRIIKWVESFEKTVKNKSFLQEHPKEFLEHTALEVMRYLVLGKPETGHEFPEKYEEGWANWIDSEFLPALRNGQIKTKDAS